MSLERPGVMWPVCFVSVQDVRVLYSQMAGREVDEPDAPIETSLDQILDYIRSHWEKVTERNRAETDSYLECKVRTSHLDVGPGSVPNVLPVTELSPFYVDLF